MHLEQPLYRTVQLPLVLQDLAGCREDGPEAGGTKCEEPFKSHASRVILTFRDQGEGTSCPM